MRLRRIISISCIILASSLPLIFSGFFLSSRFMIRMNMFERVNKEQLTTIKIPENEIEWYNQGHELILEGKMFDVKAIHLENGIYTISGLFDDDETELDSIEEYYANQEGHSKKITFQIFQNFLGIIAITNKIVYFPIALLMPNENHFFKYTSSIAEGHKQRIKMPPKEMIS